MKPLVTFEGYSTEAMYKGLNELLACSPECKKYDDGKFRVLLVPKQEFPPITLEDTYILMEKWDIPDDTGNDHIWLAVASDGEHPDGYPTLEEAMKALEIERTRIVTGK